MTRRSTLRCTIVVAVAAVLLGAAFARASLPGWIESYRQGLRLEDEGHWKDAARQFQQAIDAQPRPRKLGTIAGVSLPDYDPHVHLARCLIELGRPRDAVRHIVISARAGVTPRPALEQLRQRLGPDADTDTPPPRELPVLFIGSKPPGARVVINGELRGTTPLGPLEAPPGEHTVRLELDGYAAEETTGRARPGRNNVYFVLRPLPSPTPPRPVATDVPAAAADTREPSELQGDDAPAASPAASVPDPTAAAAVTPAIAAPAAAAARERPSVSTSVLVFALVGSALVVMLAGALILRSRRMPAEPGGAGVTVLAEAATDPGASESRCGGYVLGPVLGRGGMATTYRARRDRDGHDVAIKIPHDSCLADPSFVARFLREGKLGEQLHHPGIVRIFEAGTHEGRPFLAMELLEGETLKHALRHDGPFELRRALRIACDIGETLDYAHAKGVVHRDLKPENVMLLPGDVVRVMDFGIARLSGEHGLTTSHLFLGTPLYAAPEMVDPKNVDHRVDLYALGIILFEMLQGTVPFIADSPYRVLEMHLHEPLPSHESLARPIPGPVWDIITTLCAKRAAERYDGAATLLVKMYGLLRHDLDGNRV